MIDRLKKIPYPIAGLALSLAVLGNLNISFVKPAMHHTFGAIAGFILILLLIKFILVPKTFIQAMSLLPVASCMTTIPMALMVISTYVVKFSKTIALVIWLIGLVMNIGIMVVFTFKHALPFKLEKLFASYFVTYVGIVVAAVTCKLYGLVIVGKLAFFVGLFFYIALFIPVSIRYIKHKVDKEPIKPLIAIYAAPANLLLVGYLKLGLGWPNEVAIILWIVGLGTTVFALVQVFRQRELPFYPSYAAYTFPFVIGTVASFAMVNYLNLAGRPMEYVAYCQLFISLVLVSFVLVKYVVFIHKN